MEFVRTVFSPAGTITKKPRFVLLLFRYVRPFLILNALITVVSGFFVLMQRGILPFAETLIVLYSVSGIMLAITHSGVGQWRSWKFRLVWLGSVVGLLLILAGVMLFKVGMFYFPNIFAGGNDNFVFTFVVLPGLFTVSAIWMGVLSLFAVHIRGAIMNFQEMIFPQYSTDSSLAVCEKKSRLFGYVRALFRYALPFLILNTLIAVVTGFFTLVQWGIWPFAETLFALYSMSGIVLAITHSGVGERRSWKFRLIWLGSIAGLLCILAGLILSKVGVLYLPDIYSGGIFIFVATFFVLPMLCILSAIWKAYRPHPRKYRPVSGIRRSRSGEILINLICSLALLSLGSYSTLLEPKMLRVEQIDIVTDKVPEEVTILHLTDMHITKIGPHEQKIFQRVQELQPDMIVRTGDFLDVYDSDKKKRILQELAAIFRQFSPKYGHYVVPGNHDTWHMDAKAFAWFDELAGITTLLDDEHAFTAPAGRFRLVGLWPSTSRELTRDDVDAWWQEVEEDEFTMILGHYPDYILQATHVSVDLCLAGHLHGGGQVRIPFIGAVPGIYEAAMHFVGSDFPRKWAGGYHKAGKTRINVGVGSGGTPVRFNCPPTMTLFTLRPEV